MSAANKYGRGSGRGLTRMVPPPLGRGMVPLRRGPAPGKEKSRLEDVSLKGRGLATKGNVVASGSAGSTFQEESFQLVSCGEREVVPLYAMAIRLTPGLLETLKRVEELGEATSMKFGVNASGHVIKVGEEEFRFSSAPEHGHLCDIFEEQRKGDDGNGLLVESGAVWRKLSVIRTLSATEKDRVKARSVEAERQQKSRKAIIIDHSNSVMNNKVATSGDVNGRRAPPVKLRKEPPQKKRKIVTSSPVIPPATAVKPKPVQLVAEKPPASAMNPKLYKTAVVSSPEPPTSLRAPLPGAVVPPSKCTSLAAEEVGGSTVAKPTATLVKDKAPGSAAAGSEAGSISKTAGVVNLTELRICLINLLTENPKGMTIKAVEKALVEAMPSVRVDKKQIEKVIKAIASYHAPGKYMLREGVEKGVFAKPSPGSGSSPETVPMDSPDSPIFPETPQGAVGYADTGGERIVPSHQDLKKTDGSVRSSSVSLQRGGESAMTRAIRKATEIVRVKAERLHPSGHDEGRVVTESPGHKLEEGSLKESSTPLEILQVGHASMEGEDSPLIGSAQNERDGELERITQAIQNPTSPNVHTVGHKKENSDGSDSSSSSASDSDSDTDQDSDSDSESGSGSGSGSDSESDGSSSSGSEEENMDEDVDIISDDEEKVGTDMGEASKQKLKSKDTRTALQRQESRVQKQASRNKDHPKKQKQKITDVVMTPHGSEDVEIGDGAEGGEVCKGQGLKSTEKIEHFGAMEGNTEVEVDVISCDGRSNSPRKLEITSPGGSGKHDDNAVDTKQLASSIEVKDVGQEQVNLQTSMQPKSGSDSDHSIEEYETRAENSGVRDARLNIIGDQKDESCFEMIERRIQSAESLPSPRHETSSGINRADTPGSTIAVESLGTTLKGCDTSDVPLSPKEQSVSGGVSLRPDNMERAVLVTPLVPRDGCDTRTYREGFAKTKEMESKKRDLEPIRRLSKNVDSGEVQEKRSEVQRGVQRLNKPAEASSRAGKPTVASSRLPGVAETPAKSSEGTGKVSKVCEEPGLVSKGPDLRETATSDRVVKSNRDADTVERVDAIRRQNREASLLGKPGKASDVVARAKEYDQNSGLNRDKDANSLGRSGRDAKQPKKSFEKLDGLRRVDLPERAGLASELGDKPVKDAESQRRLSRDSESWRKSPKDVELGSRISYENEIHNFKILQKSQLDLLETRLGETSSLVSARNKESRVNSDLELGELRDFVAGDDLRVKETSRNEASTWRESSDHVHRQSLSKVHISPEKDKPKDVGKHGPDLKKPSPADVKKQQFTKKDLQKVEVPVSLRDIVRPSIAQRLGVTQEDRPESGSNRTLEAPKFRAVVETSEKQTEARSGKRSADEGGIYDLGKPPKRLAVELSHVSASSGRGESDAAVHKPGKGSSLFDSSKPSAVDMGKGSFVEGLNSLAANSSKAAVENGRMPGPRSKGSGVTDKEITDRHGSTLDGKQKTTAGLLGQGSKRETAAADSFPTNGKKRPIQTGTGDVQGRDFFALYEKRCPDLRGPISYYDQYLEYCKEFNEKYPVYLRLNTVLESDKEDFENFSRDISIAKMSEDKNRLGSIYGKVRKDYLQCRKRFKRMQKTFSLLHDELRVIKQRCKEYAEKVGQG